MYYRSSFLLPFLLLAESGLVQAHFLFAKLDDNEEEVRVFFSEPVAMEGNAIQYLGGRVAQLSMIGPSSSSSAQNTVIELTEGGEAGEYLTGRLPSVPLDNTPYIITGFLDYGEFGEGDEPKKDLQYTFSTQLSSTNPSDDFGHFFHSVVGTDPRSPLFGDATTTDNDPFTIALNNYGPPYRVVMRGVSPTTPVRVCLYEGNGSNRRVGCVEGIHNRTHHLTFDSLASSDDGTTTGEVLRPCETYFALANTTVTDEVTGRVLKTLWSSTSIIWNGPCSSSSSSTHAARPRTPVPQWYEPFTFNFRRSCDDKTSSSSSTASYSRAETTGAFSSITNNESTKMTLVFAIGVLVGMLKYHMMIVLLRCYRKRKSGGVHSKIDSAEDATVSYSDDTSTAELT